METECYAYHYDTLIAETNILYHGKTIPISSFSESREEDGTPVRDRQERNHRRELLIATEKSIADKAAAILNDRKKTTYGYGDGKTHGKLWQDLIGDSYDMAAIDNMFRLVEGCFEDYRNDCRSTFENFIDELTPDFLTLSYMELWDPSELEEEKDQTISETAVDFKKLFENLADCFAGIDDFFVSFSRHAVESNWLCCENQEKPDIGASTYSRNDNGESRITFWSPKQVNLQVMVHELAHAFQHKLQFDNGGTSAVEATSWFLIEVPSLFYELWVCALEGKKTYEKMYSRLRELKAPDIILKDMKEKMATPCSWIGLYRNHHFIAGEINNWISYNLEKAMYERLYHGTEIDTVWLCQETVRLQKIIYGDLVKEETLDPYLWVRFSRLYGYDLFYNYQYTLGYILGLHFVEALISAQKEGQTKAFIEKYHQFLIASRAQRTEETCGIMGIHLSDPHFWETAREKIMAH